MITRRLQVVVSRNNNNVVPLQYDLRQCVAYFSSNGKNRTTKNNKQWDDENYDVVDDDDQRGRRRRRRRRLDVAIVGYPNAGKSQLLNSLLGQKLAAVSRKRHTTRNGIMGVATRDQSQLVFSDTPGFMTSIHQEKPGHDLFVSAKRYMVDVDYSLLVIDAAKIKLDSDYLNTLTTLMWNAMHGGGGKFGIVLNKIDLVKSKTKLLEVAQHFGQMADELVLEKLKLVDHTADTTATIPPPPQPEELMPDMFYTCAKQGQKDEGVQEVLNHLFEMAIPNREWLLGDDSDSDDTDSDDEDDKDDNYDITTMDYSERVEEIIREKIYRTLHREVPHQVTQRNRQMELIRGETSSPSATTNVMMIHQDLLVRSKSHLHLLTRTSSANLQRIHDSAVPELRRLFRCEVLLTLNAKLISRNRR